MFQLSRVTRLLTCFAVLTSLGSMIVTGNPPALAAERSDDSVSLVHSFVEAWNAADADSVVDMFTPDATIEGSGGCCAAVGIDQIRPFVRARFGESYQIAWTEPDVNGEQLTMWSRVAAQDGVHNGVDLRQGGGPDDVEAERIDIVVRGDRISSLVLGTSVAAYARSQAVRWRGENGGTDALDVTTSFNSQPGH